ncbi:hypothetical protein D3C84_1057050 [compost metagenome]
MLEPQRVDHDAVGHGLQVGLQGQALEPCIAFEHPDGGGDQRGQVGGFVVQLHVPGLDTGDVENVTDQRQQAIGRVERHLQ